MPRMSNKADRDRDIFERLKRDHRDLPCVDYAGGSPVQLLAFVARSCDEAPGCELPAGQTSRVWLAAYSQLGRSYDIAYSLGSAHGSVLFGEHNPEPSKCSFVRAYPRKSYGTQFEGRVCKDCVPVVRREPTSRPQEVIECKATAPEIFELRGGVALLLELDLPMDEDRLSKTASGEAP